MEDRQFDALCDTIKDHEKRLSAGDTSFALLNQLLDRIQKDITSINVVLTSMQGKPAANWDKLIGAITSVISSVISGLCMLYIAKLVAAMAAG